MIGKTNAVPVYSAGANLTQSGKTFSLTKLNVEGALGFTPPKVTASTTDITAGTTQLATGEVYLVYEA